MKEVALANINSFASQIQSHVQPSEFIAVPAALLQDLIGTIRDLKEEITALHEEHTRDREEITNLHKEVASLHERDNDFEKRLDTFSENQLIQLRIINGLREDIRPHEPDNSPLIDELYSHMKVVGLKQTTFAGAAKILKRSKVRVHQLRPLLEKDKRFVILPSQSHKQKLLIRLREFYTNV